MKKSAYISFVLSTLLLASGCSDEFAGKNEIYTDSDPNSITFKAGTLTRAGEPALKAVDFPYVMASAQFVDDNGSRASYFKDFKFDRAGGSNLYTSPMNPIWPVVGSLNIMAHYPSVEDLNEATSTWQGSVAPTKIDDDFVLRNVALAKGNAVSLDLMTATVNASRTIDPENEDKVKSVELNLKHQLSSLEIHAFNGSKTKEVENPEDAPEGTVTKSYGHIIEIAGVRLINIPMVSDFDLKNEKWLSENTKTSTLEYIFQPGDKVLKMGRLGEHSGLVSVRTSGYTFFYNQHDKVEEAVDLLGFCTGGAQSLTILPTDALPEGEGKEMQLQLLIRIIQETDAWDGNHLRKYVAIYPNDIGYRYNNEKGYFLHDDGIRYIQSDRDDCAIDGSIPSDSRDQTTKPILLKDDKIENIMEFLVEEKEEGPGDVGMTFAYENYVNECWTRGTTFIEEKPDYPIIKDFRIMESAQHFGNGDNYFDANEIDEIRHTDPYAYGDGGRVPKGCIRRFAWLTIPLKLKDEKYNFKCEGGKKYIFTLDFTNALEKVTTIAPQDPQPEVPDEVDKTEFGLFDIELNLEVKDWEDEGEKVIDALGPYPSTNTITQ